jgi:hypothetical protein
MAWRATGIKLPSTMVHMNIGSTDATVTNGNKYVMFTNLGYRAILKPKILDTMRNNCFHISIL